MAAKQREQKAYSWEDLCAESGKDPEARRVQELYFLMKSIEDRAAEKLRALEDIFRLHVGERVIVSAGSNPMARDVSLRFLVPTLLSRSRKTERLDDEGESGGTLERTALDRLLERIEEGGVDRVIFCRLDRITRSLMTG